MQTLEQRREAKREYNKRWWSAHPELALAYSRKWNRANRKKRNEISGKWREANPEQFHEALRRWSSENGDKRRAYQAKRKAKDKVGFASPGIVKTLWKIQDGLCANEKCKADLVFEPFHLDHKMPLALGGKHENSNLQLLCVPCNQSKGAKHPDEWGGRMIGRKTR